MSIGNLLREIFADCTPEQAFIAGVIMTLIGAFEWLWLSKFLDLVCDCLKVIVKKVWRRLRKFIRSRKTDTAE